MHNVFSFCGENEFYNFTRSILPRRLDKIKEITIGSTRCGHAPAELNAVLMSKSVPSFMTALSTVPSLRKCVIIHSFNSSDHVHGSVNTIDASVAYVQDAVATMVNIRRLQKEEQMPTAITSVHESTNDCQFYLFIELYGALRGGERENNAVMGEPPLLGRYPVRELVKVA